MLVMLARKDFRVRYKRASLGLAWAVAMPLLQSLVLVVIFSRVGNFGSGVHHHYAAFVVAGMIPWLYLSGSVAISTQAIVDGSALTDKLWFPRAILGLVPPVSNLVTVFVTAAILLVELPIVGAPVTWSLLLLVPAILLSVGFAVGLGLVLCALYVYFRDIRFVVQAVMLVWLYVTPIVYPASALHGAGHWLDLNPLTGIVTLFQAAALGGAVFDGAALGVSLGWTGILLLVSVEVHRRHDRLFVDLL